MKTTLLVTATVLCLLIPAASSVLFAGSSTTEIHADVPQAFVAGEKSFPAGTYAFALRRESGPVVLTVRPSSGGESTIMPVVTRLARSAVAAGKPGAQIVFDAVGDKRYLSEVWFEGQDGFLLRATTDEHQHAVVPAKN